MIKQVSQRQRQQQHQRASKVQAIARLIQHSTTTRQHWTALHKPYSLLTARTSQVHFIISTTWPQPNVSTYLSFTHVPSTPWYLITLSEFQPQPKSGIKIRFPARVVRAVARQRLGRERTGRQRRRWFKAAFAERSWGSYRGC